MILSVNVFKCFFVVYFVFSLSDVGDCLLCEEWGCLKLINLIYVFDILKGKIFLFYFIIFIKKWKEW